MIKIPPEVKVSEWYPTYGYTQKELRFLYVDEGARMLSDDNGEYIIRADGPINPVRRDRSGFWLFKLEYKNADY